MSEKKTVALIGEGLLAALAAELLAGECRVVPHANLRQLSDPAEYALALVLSDGWDPLLHREAESVFRATGTPWLRGFAAFGEGALGPLVRPDRAGCTQCADERRIMADRFRRETRMLRRKLEEGEGLGKDAWVSRFSMAHLAHLAAQEAVRLLKGRPALTESAMLLVNLLSLRTSRHFVLPDPLCPVCGGLPEDAPNLARIELERRPKHAPGSYRVKSLETLKTALPRDYLDPRTGLLNASAADLASPFADASVILPLPVGDEGAAGRTHRYSDSLIAAILEGLERHAGFKPRGRRTNVRGSWRALSRHALDPRTVGLHSEAQYRLPGFPFRPFDPDREMSWVWGYSFRRREPVLVPESLAYFGECSGERFVYETSNGCAIGGSLEEAIFYGLLEVIERDSFLITWYARLPLARLDEGSARDAELELMIERLKAAAGFEVLLFNATMEHGIPAVWSMAVNTRGSGVHLICAAGAHPDPARAAKSSIHELAAMVLTLNEKFEQGREAYRRMLEDPCLVRGMEDHAMLYALPEAKERLAFLLENGRTPQTFREAFGERAWQPDLTADLADLLEAVMGCGLDVIVVDQTSPEILRNGLHCVKVIVPGMLPMTFGYHMTRLEGLGRVLTVPARLGYAREPLEPGQLNPHPHPFP